MRVEETWLSEFIELPPPEELADALMAAGVEIESVEVAVQSDDGVAPAANGSLGRRFDLSVTPNRGDLLSHLGLAREIAAGSSRRLLPSKWRLLEQGPPVQTLCRLQVDEPERARCYVGRVVRNVAVGPSPKWLVDRLAAIGQRTVNNVVDVTNYVMFELGVPLHAFDLATVAQEHSVASIRVRCATQGEQLQTLDGAQRSLSKDDLVIADAMGPLAIAGILGGARSQVTGSTQSVLLEAACFSPAGVRATAKRHSLRTEASQRFARGVDPKMAARAAERAAQLLAEVAHGEVATGAIEAQSKNDGPTEILLRLAFVQKWLGIQLSPEAIVSLLEPLQIRCARRTEAALVLAPPSFRFDLEREADLAEEIARRHGLDQIPARLPARFVASPTLSGNNNANARLGDVARRALLARGLSECVHFAFASEAGLAPFANPARTPVSLLNPLGEDQKFLRTTLLPGLLGTVRRNARRNQDGMLAFEVGTVWWQRGAAGQTSPTGLVAAEGADKPTPRERAKAHKQACDALLPNEEIVLTAVMTGPRVPSSLYDKNEMVAGPDLVAVWEAVLAAYGLDCGVGLRPGEGVIGPYNPYASASAWARVRGEAAPQRLGQLGQLDPAYVREHLKLSRGVYVLELCLSVLEALPRRALRAIAPPKFPGTRRDLAVVAPKSLASESVRAFLQRRAEASLSGAANVDVALFDIYSGANVPDGQVSLAFSLFYRGHHKTLTDDEVTPAFLSLLAAVRDEFNVSVRDGTAPSAA